MVAPTGFEPATSALRGRRPKPLDDGAISIALVHSNRPPEKRQVAGVAGVEPTHMAPETTVLPLDDTPTFNVERAISVANASKHTTDDLSSSQEAFRKMFQIICIPPSRKSGREKKFLQLLRKHFKLHAYQGEASNVQIWESGRTTTTQPSSTEMRAS